MFGSPNEPKVKLMRSHSSSIVSILSTDCALSILEYYFIQNKSKVVISRYLFVIK